MITYLDKKSGGINIRNLQYCYYQYLIINPVMCSRCKKIIKKYSAVISIRVSPSWIHFPDCLKKEEREEFEVFMVMEKLKG